MVEPVTATINSLRLVTRLEDAQFYQHLPRPHHLVELRLAGFGELLALFLFVTPEAGDGEVERVEGGNDRLTAPLAADLLMPFSTPGGIILPSSFSCWDLSSPSVCWNQSNSIRLS